MYRQVITTLLVLLATQAVAHQMTPTYPKWEPSHVEGVYKTTIEMFNKREDVEWYEIGVFNKNWEPIQFVSQYRLFNMPHLSRIKFDVYISLLDVAAAEYICSKSKLREVREQKTMVASRVCSRFK